MITDQLRLEWMAQTGACLKVNPQNGQFFLEFRNRRGMLDCQSGDYKTFRESIDAGIALGKAFGEDGVEE